jgi:hypothetical protein
MPIGTALPAMLLVTLIALGVTGCGSRSHSGQPRGGPTTMIFSPNGEPLNGGKLGRPTCAVAMSRWFNRVDTNHDGLISWAEFAIDMRTQFRRMDIDGSGYITPSGLEQFREPYMMEGAGGGSQEARSDDTVRPLLQPGQNTGLDTGQPGPNDGTDPVMSADTDMDNQVSYQEFLAQARATFRALDTAHTGMLTRAEVIKSCAASGS